MKHLGRVHRVAVSWLHEQIPLQNIELRYTKSAAMAADVYTKAFSDVGKWSHARQMVNHVTPTEVVDHMAHKHQLWAEANAPACPWPVESVVWSYDTGSVS